MSRLCAIAYFAKTKSADVVSVNDVDGSPVVGKTFKVRWNGRNYQAKILVIGTREFCEAEIGNVTAEGELEQPPFTVCEGTGIESSRSPSPLSTTSVGTASVDTAFTQKVCKLLDELIARVGQIERRMATKELQLEQQVDSQRLTGGVNELRVIGRELLKRIPQSVNRGDEIQYTYASKEFVEALRSHRVGNISQFALDLEKEVYKGDTTDLFLQVEKRMGSVEKVDFIKQCIYKYYQVEVESRASVWRSAKTALNARARRLRRNPATEAPTTPSRQLSTEQTRSTSRYLFDDDEYEISICPGNGHQIDKLFSFMECMTNICINQYWKPAVCLSSQ
ncbi:hypothetical protein Y032_0023g782 [Ancylostoma ceylanicum]|uniref:Uncharacterized protein n=1 Tax=Ancylostoma ceylanicum TaxID=53326 RepID=A0A016UYQ4_9BILA|nr:hypothetical protein Y032_0023g782 [Ancylostoma ceylanicum]